MPFPATPVLDDFNRANVGPPPSAFWTTPAGDAGFKVVSNRLVGNAADAVGYWNADTFGPNAEAYIDLTTIALQDFSINVKDLNPDSPATSSGYSLDLQFGSPTTPVQIQRFDPGLVFTNIGPAPQVAFASGDGVGFRYENGVLSVWQRSSGVWLQVAEAFDAKYLAQAGRLSLYARSTSSVFDNFGGGTISSGASNVEGAFKMTSRGVSW